MGWNSKGWGGTRKNWKIWYQDCDKSSDDLKNWEKLKICSLVYYVIPEQTLNWFWDRFCRNNFLSSKIKKTGRGPVLLGLSLWRKLSRWWLLRTVRAVAEEFAKNLLCFITWLSQSSSIFQSSVWVLPFLKIVFQICYQETVYIYNILKASIILLKIFYSFIWISYLILINYQALYLYICGVEYWYIF